MRAAPEGGGQCGSHPAVSKVENVITLQKCQDVLEAEGEKKTMMKKMMVWEPRTGLWRWVGGGGSPSPHTGETRLEVED